MNMKREIEIFESTNGLSQFFGELLLYEVNVDTEGEYFSIALSGGSTPRSIFQYLASNFKEKINWEKLLIFWSDERCVPPESNESNFRMAHESLLSKVDIPASNIFRIKGEANPIDEAKRYSEVVRSNISSPNLLLQFNLIMLGLGTDGHTASIFPGNGDLFESNDPFEVSMHPETSQSRITVTGKTINQAKLVTFLVTGENKANTVATLLNRKKGWDALPASHVDPKNGKLLWILDNKAAAYL